MILEIKSQEDRLTVAAILVKSGYTVREITIKPDKGNMKKVLEYLTEVTRNERR